MKCVEVERKLDLIFDDELDLFEKQAIQLHFEHCNSCHKSYRSLQKLKDVSQILPLALPTKAFDRQMLQAFANHHQVQKASFWKTFLIPVPVFATGLALFAFGSAGAFWVGRTTAPPQFVTETVTIEKEVPQMIADEKSQPETIIKYVKVPVIREIVKIVKINQPTQQRSVMVKNKANIPPANFSKNEAFITKIDFENFKPISDIKMKVIKKGETNE